MRLTTLLFLLVFLVSLVSAQNDPGHDSLYIEEQGDSELNGTFNVTQNLTVKGGEVEISNQFEIKGDGTSATANINSIIGSNDNYISINSLGNGREIRLLDQAATGTVHIGHGSSSSIDLNVSNYLYLMGNLFSMGSNMQILNNGTIPASDINSIVVNGTGNNRQMWITSEEITLAQGIATGDVFLGRGGSDSVNLNVTGNIIVQGSSATVNGAEVCTASNGLCTGVGGAGGGWTNTSSTVRLSNQTAYVNATLLYINNTGNRIGIGTYTPASLVDIQGGDLTMQNGEHIRWNSAVDATRAAISGDTSDNLIFYTGDGLGSGNERMRISSSGSVGIGTANPMDSLDVSSGGIVVNGTLPRIVLLENDVTNLNGLIRTNSNLLQLGVANDDLSSHEIIMNLDLSTDRVGINTTSPQAALHVNGSLRFNSLTDCTALETDTDGDLVCGSDEGGSGSSSNSAAGWTNTTTLISSNVGDNITMDSGAMFVDATNNRVGIGTATPGSELVVSSTGTGDIWIIADNDDNSASADGILRFYNDGQSTITGELRYDESDGTLELSTGSNQNHLTIDSTGDIAIGSTQPNSTLDVTGTLNVSGDAYFRAGEISLTDSSPRLIFDAGEDSDTYIQLGNTDRIDTYAAGNVASYVTSNSVQFQQPISVLATDEIYLDGLSNTYISEVSADTVNIVTGGTERLRIDSSGRLGIRTTLPATTLHVNATDGITVGTGTDGDVTLLTVNVTGDPSIAWDESAEEFDSSNQIHLPDNEYFAVGGATNGDGRFYHDGSNTFLLNANGVLYLWQNADNDMRFYTKAAERMRIDASGQVGINTTSPNSVLDVNGTFNASGDISFTGFTSCTALETDSNGMLVCGSDEGGSGSSSNSAAGWTNTTTLISSNVGVNVSVDSGVLYVDADNNKVGINTTAPKALLHVSGEDTTQTISSGTIALFENNDTDLNIEMMSTGTSDQRIIFNSNSGANVIRTRHTTDNTDYMTFAVGTTTSEVMRLTQAGEMGIGTNNPNTTLHVDGRINVTSGNDVCIDGGNCLSSSLTQDTSVGGGWTNTTTLISSNVGVNVSVDSGVLYVDADNNKVGINTTAPKAHLQIGTAPSNALSSANLGNLQPSDRAILIGTNNSNNDPMGVLYLGDPGGSTNGATEGEIRFFSGDNWNAVISAREGNIDDGSGVLVLRTRNSSANSMTDRITIGQTGNVTIDTSTLFVDAENDKVGIGTAAPAETLHVFESSGGTDPTYATGSVALLERSGDTWLTFFSPNTAEQGIIFADPEQGANNWISYDHGDSSMRFRSSNAERMRIDSDGEIAIGRPTALHKLHINDTDTTLMIEGNGITRAGMIIRTNDVDRWDINAPSGSSDLSFDNNSNTPILRLQQDGNVGIGTTTPGRELHVNGSIAIQAGDGIYLNGSTGSHYLKYFTSDPRMAFIELGTEILTMKNGNVGIGTNNPNETLHVSGGINVTSGNDICISGGECLSTVAAAGAGGWTDGGAVVSLTASTDNVSAGTLYVDNTNSEVGIGTTTPTRQLDVSSSTAGSLTGIRVQHTDNTDSGSHARLESLVAGASGGDPQVKLTVAGATDWSIGIDNSDSDKIKIGNSATIGTSTRLSIDTSGNVGIGTNESNKVGWGGTVLTIEDTIPSGPSTIEIWENNNSMSDDDAIGVVTFLAGTAGNRVAEIIGIVEGTSENSGRLTFQTMNSGTLTEKMRIDNDGNIGIGTTSPQYLLDVDGDMRVNESIFSGLNEGSYIQFTEDPDDSTELRINMHDNSGTDVGFTFDGDDKGLNPLVDSDVNLGRTGVRWLKLWTDDIAVTNSIGIGIDTPATNLHIHEGTFRVNRTDGTAAFITTSTARAGAVLDLRDSSGFGMLFQKNNATDGLGYGAANRHAIRMSGGESMAIVEGGDVHMVIDSAGRMGLNKTDPGARLNLGDNADIIVDDGYICVDDNGGSLGSCAGSTDGVIYADDFVCNGGNCLGGADIDESDLTITGFLLDTGDTATGNYTFDTTTLHIDSTNNRIGIGTATPDDFLEIVGSLGGTGIHLDSTSGAGINIDRAGDTNEGRMQFSTAGSVNAQIGLENDGTSDFHIGTGGFSTRWMTINVTNGNVGIGTISPSNPLHIVVNDLAVAPLTNYLVIENNGSGTGLNILTNSSNNGAIVFGDQDDNNIGQIIYDHGPNAMRFYTSDTEQMRIESSGEIGIGTTNPETLLHVDGSAAHLRIGNTDSRPTLEIGTSAGDNWSIVSGVNNDLYIKPANADIDTTDSDSILTIESAGELGINEISPATELHITASSNPTIRLSEAGSTENYTEIIDVSRTQFRIQKISEGNAIVDIDPIPTDKTNNAHMRLFRTTNTTGDSELQIYAGNGTSTLNTLLSGKGNSYINAITGNVGIGETNPATLLHITGSTDPEIRFENSDSSDVWQILSEDSTNQLRFTESGSGIFELTLDSGVGVGIADVAPDDALSVGGDIDASGSMEATAFCPDGLSTCDPTTAEAFTANGIGATNIYAGSGGEIDIQDNMNMNDNTLRGLGVLDSTTDENMRMAADTDLFFDLDEDNDGSNEFHIRDGANTEVLVIDESGNLQMDGALTAGSVLGTWASRSWNTVYQAATDVFVICTVQRNAGSTVTANASSDSSNPPTTLRGAAVLSNGAVANFYFPVKSGDYYRCQEDVPDGTYKWVYEIPIAG